MRKPKPRKSPSSLDASRVMLWPRYSLAPRALKRLQEPIPHTILEPSPSDPVRKKSCEPDGGANGIAHGCQPQLARNLVISQAPHASRICQSNPQNRVSEQI